MKRGLAVHVALGWRTEHAFGAVLEAHSGHGLGAAVDIGVVLREAAVGFDGFNHALVVELDAVVDPAVIDRWRLGAQHHVFDPVSCWPAGGCVATQADTPGLGHRRQRFSWSRSCSSSMDLGTL